MDHTEDPRKPENQTGGPLDRPVRERPEFRGDRPPRGRPDDGESRGRGHRHHHRPEDHTEDPMKPENQTGGPFDHPERERPERPPRDDDDSRRGGRGRGPRHYHGPEDHTEDPMKPENQTGGPFDRRERERPERPPRDDDDSRRGSRGQGPRHHHGLEDHTEDPMKPDNQTGGPFDRPERERPEFRGERPSRDDDDSRGLEDHTEDPMKPDNETGGPLDRPERPERGRPERRDRPEGPQRKPEDHTGSPDTSDSDDDDDSAERGGHRRPGPRRPGPGPHRGPGRRGRRRN